MHEAKEWEDLGGQDLRAQIYGQGSIPEPPHHSTFKARGGGLELDMHLSMAYIGMLRSMTRVPF
jgi:hypothetical protein